MVSMHDGTRVTARIGRWAAVEQLFLSFTTCTCMCMCMSCCMYRIFVIMAPRVRGLGVGVLCGARCVPPPGPPCYFSHLRGLDALGVSVTVTVHCVPVGHSPH